MALDGNAARDISRKLIDDYFRTTSYPYTRHHIDSFDQFVQQDMVNIIRSQNPVMILKELLPGNNPDNLYRYQVQIFIGGQEGTALEIGSPTITLQNTEEVRLLYPNEARLRNVSYASTVYADILVKITYIPSIGVQPVTFEESFSKWQLFSIPIMLHSRYCILHNKPKDFLREAGECPYDNGGYFIVDGAEKVLITRQEQAFNTLYITPQTDPKVAIFASISCLSAKTRQVKRVAISLTREMDKEKAPSYSTIHVSLPFVRKSIPLFVLFRALGIQSDEEILKMIFPDFESAEAKLLLPKLHASIIDAFPFMNSYTAIEYIKTLTKGFSIAHVLDIIRNQLFIHMPNDSISQGLFLGDCVRKILRVSEGYDQKTDRDDTRNQRCLTSGFLIQELFNNSYKLWIKAFALEIDKEYNFNKGTYSGENFRNIFSKERADAMFLSGRLTQMIMKGFKGKWGTGLGEDKSGVLQALSRLSYTDFMSHCRRVILDFDTGMKLTGPRKLHTSQYGYFCTSETPTGASIGITKNLCIMTTISTSSQTSAFFDWLYKKGGVRKTEQVTINERIRFVPVYVNGGIFGYTDDPKLLTAVLKLCKRSGCLPYSVSISFSIRDRKVYLYLDAGRPLRPLIWLESSGQRIPIEKLKSFPTWRHLVMGRLKMRESDGLESTDFIDPLADNPSADLDMYMRQLRDHTGAIEYIDPYEQNECFIANHPAYITAETTHIEVHPSTIMSMMTSLIPYAPHNQSPRNQLSCSQSKQGVSIYATNWRNRFDNTANVLCYGEMPITRTIYNNYLGDGKMPYGMNCVLAIACWSGYNQEDGIVMNYDAVKRGMFRTMSFRSYEAYEEDDEKAGTKVRFGNPAQIAIWKDLKPGLDYSKLDERGIIREGEYVDENTVIVGAYMISTVGGQIKDASTMPQVWTRGRVEKIAVMVNNMGLRLIKIRVVQDRIPELGDKFCLTEDHDVLTENGWKSIKDVTLKDKVAQLHENKVEYVHPTHTYMFSHSDVMYRIHTALATQYVTNSHRVYVEDASGTRHLIHASLLYMLQEDPYYLIDMNQNKLRITHIEQTETNEVDDYVYCLSVPSQIFLVRRNGEDVACWTGNSNRHGQKGTIGALLRGHDMPRTESGIVPDMIMNPHAIPSRMTIAQNLEQLMGKTAAMSGAIGDGTSFMNDGSPQEAIGGILEKLGFEKYGNEVMYNGATGEQIQASIFIGPVYGMRLKHMVEDKWQARGQGRKEARTHQPTGGRGSQGGLKIGEMDRDAIIGHGGMAFVKESFMERSDGAKIPLCVACGTIPIYNPRMKLEICQMCDGPVQYIGNTVNDMDLLPPLGRPRSNIVQVEMPYSMKLLTQEQETYLNISMRYITTSGIQRLRPISTIIEEEEERVLKPMILPSVVVPAYVENKAKESISEEELDNLGAQFGEMSEAEKKRQDAVQDVLVGESMVGAPVQVVDSTGAVVSGNVVSVGDEESFGEAPLSVANLSVANLSAAPLSAANLSAANLSAAPLSAAPLGAAPTIISSSSVPGIASTPMEGGFSLDGEEMIDASSIGGGPMIAIRTDPEAMAADGLITGMSRPLRRASFHQSFMAAPMQAAAPRYQPAAMDTIRINKLG